MAKVIINRFDGGMTNEPRDEVSNRVRISSFLNNTTYKHKLLPHRSLELDAASESTFDSYRIGRMLVANNQIFGYGVVSSVSANFLLYNKTTATDPASAWQSLGNSQSLVRTNNLFLLYQSYIYMSNTTGINKSNLSGSAGVNDYTTNLATGQGIVHSKDDIMYVPSNNKILKNTSGATPSFSVALTLPTDATIQAICEHGNYLAIATNQPNGTATVYLWNRDDSLTTLSEKIDWGVGTFGFLESLGGVLVGITRTSSSSSSITPRMVCKYYNGSTAELLQEFICSSLTFYQFQEKVDNTLYFTVDATVNGSWLIGVWKMVRRPDGQIVVSFDRTLRNDTALSAGNASIYGLCVWGDYMFVSYQEPSGLKYTIWRTNDAETYSATSFVETTINQGMDPRDKPLKKQLMSTALHVDALTSGQQVVVKYRIDSNPMTAGSWTTVGTLSTVGATVLEMPMIAAGTQFTSGRDYEFRLESTGGAVINSFCYEYKNLQTLL